MINRVRSAICALPLALALALLSGGHAMAASYNETINGDLSGNGFAPTVLALDAGSNTLQGIFGQSPTPNVADLDYIAVTVPTGYLLSGLTLLNLNPGGANSFLGVQAGSQMTLLPSSFDPSPLLGWAHIYTNQQGSNLLPALGVNGGLAAGTYTFWINETDQSDFYSYGLDFQVTAVPEPSAWAMLCLGLTAMCFAAGRRRRHQR